jgi:hypothetical protein
VVRAFYHAGIESVLNFKLSAANLASYAIIRTIPMPLAILVVRLRLFLSLDATIPPERNGLFIGPKTYLSKIAYENQEFGVSKFA